LICLPGFIDLFLNFFIVFELFEVFHSPRCFEEVGEILFVADEYVSFISRTLYIRY